MKKAREFWINEETVMSWIGKAQSKRNYHFIGGIHVREVVPLDWEKIWKNFNKQVGEYECQLPEEYMNDIQQLVEKSLRGELE